MQIVIHAGGIPFNGNTIKERSLGGSESAAYYTAKELAARGHQVVVFTETDEPGEFDGVTYVGMGNRTQPHPMGEAWHFYCENTPHEVNIIQRQPGGFMFHIQSKINLWWAHDIALKRNNPPFMAQLWQTDRVLPVSNWFKDQITNAWLCDPDIISPIHNGVDYSLFDQFQLKDNTHPFRIPQGAIGSGAQGPTPITLLYSSRPERGLENLVKIGGIMEQLIEKAPHVKLKVCGYEHPVPALDGYYKMLRARCDELPNVEHLGQLTKQELARIQCEEADVWCYPTEFEEVSCITAMECMAAGMYVLTTNTAVLPETTDGYENITRFNYGEDIVDKFVDWLTNFNNKFRRRPFRGYSWSNVADEFEEIIRDCFSKYGGDVDALSRHFLRNSDILTLNAIAHPHPDSHMPRGINEGVIQEVYDLYDPWRSDPTAYAEHYANGTEQMYDGPNFKYEDSSFVEHPRFREIATYIHKHLKDGARVIDYGCAHGMFTNYLGKMFPKIDFVGIDVSPAAIKCAQAKKVEMALNNVHYILNDWLDSTGWSEHKCDLIILGEILEHVPDPVEFMRVVKKVVDSAHVIITTPIGPWEEMSYEKEFPKRYHLHHFERSDLDDLFGHHENFGVNCLPTTHTPAGELLGWYVTKFYMGDATPAAFPIDYTRKISETKCRQTVSFCMIAKDAEESILKLLRSVESYVDEVIIGLDKTTTDRTRDVILGFELDLARRHRSPQMSVTVFDIPSPLEIGFDSARNLTIEKASKHWVMWADADEELICGERITKYLRQNGWNGYGIPQHHFSTEPLGVLSTDFPVRLFRRDENIRFKGVVHEHPEHKDKPNDGVGFAYVLNEIHFAHNGYTTEAIRRGRFQRNITLMSRDREENPDRLLGKFLWIRDLALMCRFDLEQTQGMVTEMMQHRATEGLKLWEDTIDNCSDHPQVRRMIRDHLEFYDTLTRVLNQGFVFKMNFTSGQSGDQLHLDPNAELSAQFLNRKHLDKFLSVVIDEEVKDYGTKYH